VRRRSGRRSVRARRDRLPSLPWSILRLPVRCPSVPAYALSRRGLLPRQVFDVLQRHLSLQRGLVQQGLVLEELRGEDATTIDQL
jgi:hypothetical protein